MLGHYGIGQGLTLAISFKGAHFPKEVFLHAVFFHIRHSVSAARSRLIKSAGNI